MHRSPIGVVQLPCEGKVSFWYFNHLGASRRSFHGFSTTSRFLESHVRAHPGNDHCVLPFLFERHADAGGFRLNLGTAAGTDIESVVPDVVAAETFAAVHPLNNRKLTKDMEKLARTCPMAKARYVFFGAPGFKHERQIKLEAGRAEGVEVWAIEI